MKHITVGHVYAYHPNGNRKQREIVRVIGTNTQYCRTKGTGRLAVPYNYAYREHLHRASRAEIQAFVQTMPI